MNKTNRIPILTTHFRFMLVRIGTFFKSQALFVVVDTFYFY